MKNHRGILIGVLFLLFIALIAVVAYSQRDKITGALGGGAQNPNQPSSDNAPKEFPLKKGSKNEYVRKYQAYLITKKPCLPLYGTDGDWGNETESCSISVLGTNVIDWNKYKSLGLT